MEIDDAFVHAEVKHRMMFCKGRKYLPRKNSSGVLKPTPMFTANALSEGKLESHVYSLPRTISSIDAELVPQIQFRANERETERERDCEPI